LCGLLHAQMETTAHVVTASQFHKWVVANGGHS
jgi:heme/copper-type cytochrome/quinol oxidase subunit 2